jgi:hypothetical protein
MPPEKCPECGKDVFTTKCAEGPKWACSDPTCKLANGPKDEDIARKLDGLLDRD